MSSVECRYDSDMLRQAEPGIMYEDEQGLNNLPPGRCVTQLYGSESRTSEPCN